MVSVKTLCFESKTQITTFLALRAQCIQVGIFWVVSRIILPLKAAQEMGDVMGLVLDAQQEGENR